MRILVSFDIVNLYTNVPVANTLDVLRVEHVSAECNNELVHLISSLLNQNYFTYTKDF